MIIGLAIAVPSFLLLVLIAAVAGSGSDRDDPNALAQQFVDGINSGDADAAEAVLCHDATMFPATLQEIIDSGLDVRLTVPLEPHYDPVAGGGAMGTFEGTAAAGRYAGDVVGTVWADQPEEDGPWCISEVRMAIAPHL